MFGHPVCRWQEKLKTLKRWSFLMNSLISTSACRQFPIMKARGASEHRRKTTFFPFICHPKLSTTLQNLVYHD